MNVLALRADGTLETFCGSAFNGFSEEKFYNEVRLLGHSADYYHNGVLKGVAIYLYRDGELTFAVHDYFGFDDAEKAAFEAKFGREIGEEICVIQDNN
tara:strand:- start:6818 stop:7111 length:294 start_codon:yes stop_codon:yes gene_type:complete